MRHRAREDPTDFSCLRHGAWTDPVSRRSRASERVPNDRRGKLLGPGSGFGLRYLGFGLGQKIEQLLAGSLAHQRVFEIPIVQYEADPR